MYGCNNSMKPHMPCPYSDIAMYRFELKALSYSPTLLCWKGLKDDIFVVWKQSQQELHKFFEFMNRIDTPGKIKFTAIIYKSIANNDSGLECLSLSLHINESNKICVDVYAKPTNSFA